jgi:hypothetical protein
MRIAPRIRQETLMSAEVVAQADTHYTSSVDFERCTGVASVLIISTAGTVTITQQCSLDDITWYDPINNAGVALGVVCTAKTVTTGIYVAYSPVATPYVRFKVVETNTAQTSVTVKLLFQV